MELVEEKKKLIQIREAQMKQKALQSFPYFFEKIINYDSRYIVADFQIDFMKEVQLSTEILLLLPRGHGKSELITIAYPIWRMCKDPNIKILIRNENSDNAEKFLSAIKSILTENPILIALFGQFKKEGNIWSSDQIIISQRNVPQKDPTVATGGLNKSMVGGHFNLIIDDDLVSNYNSQTKVMVDKVIDFHNLTPPLADERNFQWITIGTRWTYYDLYNRIMEFEPHVKVIKMSAIKDDGSILFPELFTYEKLMKKKGTLGSYQFSCQYLNEPIDDKDATFKHSWVSAMFDFDQKNIPNNINNFILVDPAISQAKRSDFTSILVVAMDADRKIYIREIIHAKLTQGEQIDTTFVLVDKYHPEMVGIEANAYQKVLGEYYENQMVKNNFYFPLKQYSWHTNKEVRIKKLQPYFERFDIHCDRRLENSDNLEYELLKFPKAEHDDTIDTLASFLSVAFPPDPLAEKKEEKIDMNKLVIEHMFGMRDREEAQEEVYDLISPYDDVEII